MITSITSTHPHCSVTASFDSEVLCRLVRRIILDDLMLDLVREEAKRNGRHLPPVEVHHISTRSTLTDPRQPT